MKLHNLIESIANSESFDITKVGDSQNLKDKEIIEFLGDN